jgi:ferredoxin
MPWLANTSAAELRDWLDSVSERETTMRLMAALEYKDGDSVPAIAERYGWEESTVEEWFEAFESKPLDVVIDESERYHRVRTAPFVPDRHPQARLEYLNYEVLNDHEWQLDDDDLFQKAHDADLPDEDYGRLAVRPSETILEAAENRGFDWPYACRGGACSNCAVILKEGEVAMPGDTVLTPEAIEEGNVRLTCVGVPMSEEVKVVYNAKSVEVLEDLLLPPAPYDGGMTGD